MLVRFARYLYIPADQPRLPSTAIREVQETLRTYKLAVGPSGEGIDWKPFRPSGRLLEYAETLNLQMPTIAIEWRPTPTPIEDPFLPAGQPYSRCPTCVKLIPTLGSSVPHPTTGEIVRIPIEQCIGCGTTVENWEQCEDRIVFESSFHVALLADGFSGTLPTLAEIVPEFAGVIGEAINRDLREVFVAW